MQMKVEESSAMIVEASMKTNRGSLERAVVQLSSNAREDLCMTGQWKAQPLLDDECSRQVKEIIAGCCAVVFSHCDNYTHNRRSLPSMYSLRKD